MLLNAHIRVITNCGTFDTLLHFRRLKWHIRLLKGITKEHAGVPGVGAINNAFTQRGNLIMTIKDRIKKELADRLMQAQTFIEIQMKKSGDAVIIMPDGPVNDPETIYELSGYKLEKIYAAGLDALAKEVMNYDRTVAWQQDLMIKLDEFLHAKILTGLATPAEKRWYADTFEGLFGYDPFEDAAALCAYA